MSQKSCDSYLLGMDVGTTNIKAILYGEDGSVVASASRQNQLIMPKPNFVEQSAMEWWSNAREIFREITQKAGTEIVSSIKGICISSHTITLLPLDGDGNVLRNAIIWMDSRSQRELDEIMGQLGEKRYISIIGAQPSVTFLPNKLLWMKKNEPEILQKTRFVMQANSYLNYCLTGVISMDLSQASLSQCLDCNTMEWSGDISRAIGIDLDRILPKPQKSGEVIGAVTRQAAAETGLVEGIPVVAGASDCMTSMYATGMSKLGEAGESSGTTSMIFVGSDKKSAADLPVTTKPCDIAGMPYVYDAPITTTGAAINWYLDTIGTEEKRIATERNRNVYDYLNQEAASAQAGSNGVIFLPYLQGERAPLWNSYAKGMFVGLTLNTGRKEMARAIFEGTSFAIRHVMDTIRQAGAAAESIRITGGGARSKTWSQIKASMLHMPVLLLDEKTGEVPFGDALIAGNAVGVFSDLSEAVQRLITVKEVIEPDPEWEKIYDELYPFYLNMYRHLDQDLYQLQRVVERIY